MKLYEYKEILYDFLYRWTDDNIIKMSLDEYISVKNKDTFCYWVETKTRMLGSINGATAIKFGIYEREKIEKHDKRFIHDEKYTWSKQYGNNRKIVFDNIKQYIIKIIQLSKLGNFELIDDIPLSSIFKWKIAYLYSNERLIPVFSTEILKKIASYYGLKIKNKTKISQIQNIMMKNKPAHLNVHEFMIELCDKFNSKKEKAVDNNKQKRIKRKASDGKNTDTYTRTLKRSSLDTVIINQIHNKIQQTLEKRLKNEYGEKNVILEENYVDVKLIQPDYITFYEIKSSSYASDCIKEALGQILLYSLNDNDCRPKKLIIVGQYPANESEIKYIEYLKENIKLNIDYINIEIE